MRLSIGRVCKRDEKAEGNNEASGHFDMRGFGTCNDVDYCG